LTLNLNTKMEQKFEDHKDDILDYFSGAFDNKYRRGQEEHGGFLGDVPATKLGFEIKDEALDLFAYVYCLIGKLHKIGQLVELGCRESTPDYVLRGIIEDIKKHLK